MLPRFQGAAEPGDFRDRATGEVGDHYHAGPAAGREIAEKIDRADQPVPSAQWQSGGVGVHALGVDAVCSMKRRQLPECGLDLVTTQADRRMCANCCRFTRRETGVHAPSGR